MFILGAIFKIVLKSGDHGIFRSLYFSRVIHLRSCLALLAMYLVFVVKELEDDGISLARRNNALKILRISTHICIALMDFQLIPETHFPDLAQELIVIQVCFIFSYISTRFSTPILSYNVLFRSVTFKKSIFRREVHSKKTSKLQISHKYPYTLWFLDKVLFWLKLQQFWNNEWAGFTS